MVEISKREKEYLQGKGFVYTTDLHRTRSMGKKTTYFATESSKLIRVLTDYKNQIIVKG